MMYKKPKGRYIGISPLKTPVYEILAVKPF